LGGEKARLDVSNSGAMISAEEVASLTEPFRRVGMARTGDGLGLGLSIAASVAQAHGGQLTIDPLGEGGLRVLIALPVAPRTENPSDDGVLHTPATHRGRHQVESD
jgi:signal transduction histidine kinase